MSLSSRRCQKDSPIDVVDRAGLSSAFLMMSFFFFSFNERDFLFAASLAAVAIFQNRDVTSVKCTCDGAETAGKTRAGSVSVKREKKLLGLG